MYDCLGGAGDKQDLDKSMRIEGEMDIWFTHYRIARDAGFGIRADTALINTARYVAVAPREIATGVRDLPFTALEGGGMKHGVGAKYRNKVPQHDLDRLRVCSGSLLLHFTPTPTGLETAG